MPVAIPAPLLALASPLPPLDPALTAPCPNLPLATDDAVPALIANHVSSAALYHACRQRQARLSEAAQARQRIEQERINRANAALQEVTDGR